MSMPHFLQSWNIWKSAVNLDFFFNTDGQKVMHVYKDLQDLDGFIDLTVGPGRNDTQNNFLIKQDAAN